MKVPRPSFSIILETENLGMASIDDLRAALTSLEEQTLSPKRANEVLLVAGRHLSSETLARLRKDFPWTTVVTPDQPLGYTEAKMFGAGRSTGDVLVFADADARYENTWLEGLVDGFISHPDATVTSGDTRIEGNDPYPMALTLMWMLPVKRTLHAPEQTRTFHLNNFAIQRSALLAIPFPHHLPLYRGKVPLWREQLLARGHVAYRVPGTRAFHAPPQGVGDWWYRMLILGRDFVAKSDFKLLADGAIVEERSASGRFLQALLWNVHEVRQLGERTLAIARENPARMPFVILAIPLALFFVMITTIGALIACFKRDYLLDKITARENAQIV